MATISGGSGNDSLDGTSGNDTIVGNEGNDTISAGAGDDSIDAGPGNDSVFGGGGADTVSGGDGPDYIEGEAGDDSISGGAGADSIHGNEDNDWIDGGADNDTLYGDIGNDTILGGDGDDLIYAGDGDDVLRGGAGDDTLYGHAGADSFVVTGGSGFDMIEDYSAADGDLIAIDYPGITSYSDLQPYLSDDGNWGTLISFPDGSVTQVKWLNYATLSASNFTFGAAPVCFLKGTLIGTAAGPRPVETLAPGDLIVTYDHGLQPLRFLSSTTYRFRAGRHRMKPIRLKPDALGPGSPAVELLVSPQHRIAVPQSAPQRLVAARKLLPMPAVSERPSCRLARYYHLLLDRHELVRANGAWAETLLLTGYSAGLARLPAALRRVKMAPARPIGTTAQAARVLASRARKAPPGLTRAGSPAPR